MTFRSSLPADLAADRARVLQTVSGHPFNVGEIITGDLHASRPYSFTMRIGCIVRVRRFATEREAVNEHAQAVADVILLASKGS